VDMAIFMPPCRMAPALFASQPSKNVRDAHYKYEWSKRQACLQIANTPVCCLKFIWYIISLMNSSCVAQLLAELWFYISLDTK